MYVKMTLTIDYSVCRHKVSDYAADKHSKISRLYLTKLILNTTNLSDDVFRAFGKCKNIQHLELANCEWLGD